MDYQAILKQFEHLNYINPDKFEVEDLDLLMRGVEDRSGVTTAPTGPAVSCLTLSLVDK